MSFRIGDVLCIGEGAFRSPVDTSVAAIRHGKIYGTVSSVERRHDGIFEVRFGARGVSVIQPAPSLEALEEAVGVRITVGLLGLLGFDTSQALRDSLGNGYIHSDGFPSVILYAPVKRYREEPEDRFYVEGAGGWQRGVKYLHQLQQYAAVVYGEELDVSPIFDTCES